MREGGKDRKKIRQKGGIPTPETDWNQCNPLWLQETLRGTAGLAWSSADGLDHE